jgi:hypothetical protein
LRWRTPVPNSGSTTAETQKRAGDVVRQIEEAGGQAIVVKANVSNKNDVDDILSRSIDVPKGKSAIGVDDERGTKR